MRDLPEVLRPGDLLVFNDTRVIPARLRARRDASGGKVEFLLLPPGTAGIPETGAALDQAAPPPVVQRVLTKAGGKLQLGESFTLSGGCKALLAARHGAAGDTVEFLCSAAEFERLVREQGEVPLPPYIHRPPGPSRPLDKERYQTVFAHTPGAVAAPTAGLHFSTRLLEGLKARGLSFAYLTLHVGPGTFRPVKAEEIEEHFVDPEPYFIPAQTVAAVRAAKREGRRVIAVGTTSLRALEGALGPGLDAETPAGGRTGFQPVQTAWGRTGFQPVQTAWKAVLQGQTGLFVYPPFKFRVVDALLTNFHIPKSSLLMLVCAFASPGGLEGIEYVQRAYQHAVESGYRFYSYGDACLFV